MLWALTLISLILHVLYCRLISEPLSLRVMLHLCLAKYDARLTNHPCIKAHWQAETVTQNPDPSRFQNSPAFSSLVSHFSFLIYIKSSYNHDPQQGSRLASAVSWQITLRCAVRDEERPPDPTETGSKFRFFSDGCGMLISLHHSTTTSTPAPISLYLPPAYIDT